MGAVPGPGPRPGAGRPRASARGRAGDGEGSGSDGSAGDGSDVAALDSALRTDARLRARLFGLLGSSSALGDHLVAEPTRWTLLRAGLPSPQEVVAAMLGAVEAVPEEPVDPAGVADPANPDDAGPSGSGVADGHEQSADGAESTDGEKKPYDPGTEEEGPW